MKLFGQYLVDKQMITEEVLLNALMEQMNSVPSLSEVCFKNKLLTTAQMLKAFSYQTQHQTEFKKACSDLGFWTSEFENQVNNELKKIKIPLGQILVKNGSLNFQTITRALDDYLADSSQEEVSTPTNDTLQVAPTVENNLELAPEAPREESPVSTVESSGPIDAGLLQNYAELLDAAKITALTGLFDSLKVAAVSENRQSALAELFVQIAKGIHEIKGMARFIKATATERLADTLETTVLAASKTTSDMEIAEVDMLTSYSGEVLKTIIDIKETLLESGSESAYLSLNKDRFETTCKDLANLGDFFSSKIGATSTNDPVVANQEAA